MRKTIISIGVVTVLGAGAGLVQAGPLVLPAGEPVFFQYNNLEQTDVTIGNGIAVPGGPIDVNGDGILDTPASEGNWGVVNVSSVQHGAVTAPHSDISGGPLFFFDDGPGGTQGQVTGLFYGVTLTSSTTATDGWLDLYWSDAGSDVITALDLDGNPATGTYDNPAARTTANTMPGFADPGAGQTFLARLAFKPGIVDNDNTTTFKSTAAITSGVTGQSEGFADVVDINNDGFINALDGPWANAFNGNWFHVELDGSGTPGDSPGELRDFRFSTFYNFTANGWDGPGGTFQPGNLPGGIEGLRSNDPGRLFTVPEPFTLGIMSAGLLGIGLTRRRKKA